MSKETKRWECCLEIVKGDVPIDELLLTNIKAPTYHDANNMVVKRGLEYVNSANYSSNVTLKVRALYEEGSVPITVAKPYISTQHRYATQQRTGVQQTGSTYKPFKCPLPDLCDKFSHAKLVGTSAIFFEEETS